MATVSGWGLILNPDAVVLSGIKRLPSSEFAMGQFLQAYRNWLFEQLAMHSIRSVYFEAPLPARDQRNQNSARKLMALAVITELICYDFGIVAEPVNVNTVKKFFTGDGSANKQMMVDQCRLLGLDPVDHNAADGTAVTLYGVAQRDTKTYHRRFALPGAAA